MVSLNELPNPADSTDNPIAIVAGRPWEKVPTDLYIPAAALRIFLESFEGPLDLLLYLVKRNNLDILELNLLDITDQYLEYIAMMESLEIDLAAEYLVMAATLAEYKSRMLLPRPDEEQEEDDPRPELIRRLQEYRRFQQVAAEIDALPRSERDFFTAMAGAPQKMPQRELPKPSVEQLTAALVNLLQRAELITHHQVEREQLSTREWMSNILQQLEQCGTTPTSYISFCRTVPTRSGVVVAVLALMELVREQLVELVQTQPYGDILVRAAGGGEDG